MIGNKSMQFYSDRPLLLRVEEKGGKFCTAILIACFALCSSRGAADDRVLYFIDRNKSFTSTGPRKNVVSEVP